MKKMLSVLLIGLAVSLSLPAAAENRGVTVNFTSDGKGIDLIALNATRKLIGSAVSAGVVDTFTINPLRSNAATPKNIGYSVCVEAGLITPAQSFDAFVKRVKFVHPKRGTTMEVQASASCQKAPEVATPVSPASCGGIMGKLCPDNLICVDDPRDSCDPAQGGKDCPGVCNGK